jgi:hypothetical protein
MIIADLVQLLYRVPGARPIFLRREQGSINESRYLQSVAS